MVLKVDKKLSAGLGFRQALAQVGVRESPFGHEVPVICINCGGFCRSRTLRPTLAPTPRLPASSALAIGLAKNG